MGFLSLRIATFVVIGLGFCAWVVALAGIATITDDCYDNYLGDGQYLYKGTSTVLTGLNQNCVRGLQFQWWGVWFEFIVLVYALVYCFTNTLAQHQATLSGLLATVTAINMWNARVFMYQGANASSTEFNIGFPYAVASRQSGLNTAAAGYVMFCTFNLMLLLLIGSGFLWFGDHSSHRAGAASSGLERGPPPTFTPMAFAAPAYSPRATGDPAVTR